MLLGKDSIRQGRKNGAQPAQLSSVKEVNDHESDLKLLHIHEF
ncbi:hypothetical protein ADIAL_1409 [Alkalibacterium sp. AK22]|nr:hypothetical protein ADIAL_1409 [Alkalibacterium sp. AK22]